MALWRQASQGCRVVPVLCSICACGAEGRDAGREGQGLQSCKWCICNAKSKCDLAPLYFVQLGVINVSSKELHRSRLNTAFDNLISIFDGYGL